MLVASAGGCDIVFGIAEREPLSSDAPATDAPAPLTDCPGGYSSANGSFNQYRVVPMAMDWLTAAVDCRNDESPGTRGRTHLVVLDDDAERDALQTFVGGASFWVGLSSRREANRYQWVTAQPVAYPMLESWQPGEPNDPVGCVRVRSTVEPNGSPSLLDGGLCSQLFRYVCECDLHPDDGSRY